jgi:hypothetical protein
VAALDEQIGRDDDPSVRRRDDRGVVARPEDGVRRALESGGDPGDEPELPGVGNGDDVLLTIGPAAVRQPCATFYRSGDASGERLTDVC